jgi:hypothetical protein
MEIHGNDLLIDVNDTQTVRERVRRIVRERWPDCVIQQDNDDVFFHEDVAAAESWDADGRTENNRDHMIHVLHRPKALTIVHDEREGSRTGAIARAIDESLRSFKRAKPAGATRAARAHASGKKRSVPVASVPSLLPSPQAIDVSFTTDGVDAYKRVDCKRYGRCLDVASDAGWPQFHCNDCHAYDPLEKDHPSHRRLQRIGAAMLKLQQEADEEEGDFE